MENEIMNYEADEIVEGEIMADEGSGIGTGTAMLIGAGLAFAVTAGVKLVKKGIAAIKAKKEAKKAEAAEHEFFVAPDGEDNETE